MRLFLIKILNEITARQGRRTGGFEFDERVIQKITDDIINFINLWKSDQLEDDDDFDEDDEDEYFEIEEESVEDILASLFKNSKPNFFKPKFITSTAVRNPTTGEKEFIYIYARYMKAKASANIENKTISVNIPKMSEMDRASIESTIEHELTHLFDKGLEAGRQKGSEKYKAWKRSEDDEKYFLSPQEVKANTQQIIRHFNLMRQNGTLPNNFEEALRSYSKWEILHPYYETNQQIMRKLQQAFYYALRS